MDPLAKHQQLPLCRNVKLSLHAANLPLWKTLPRESDYQIIVISTIPSSHLPPKCKSSPQSNDELGWEVTMAAEPGDNLRSLIFKVEDGTASLSVLDQLLLPHETKYIPVKNVGDAWDAVRKQQPNFLSEISISAPSSINEQFLFEYYAYLRSVPCAFAVLH